MTDRNDVPHAYLLRMTPDQAESARILLKGAGIPFDPVANAAAYDTQDDTYWVMTADDLVYAIPAINEHLENAGLPHRVPEPQDLAQTLEALHLAYYQFEYRRLQPSEDLWKSNFPDWETMTRRYPALFALQQGEPPSRH